MAVAVLRREGESNEKVISRWKKKAQQSRIMQEVRQNQRYKKPLNKTKEKHAAKMRAHFRAQRKIDQFYA